MNSVLPGLFKTEHHELRHQLKMQFESLEAIILHRHVNL